MLNARGFGLYVSSVKDARKISYVNLLTIYAYPYKLSKLSSEPTEYFQEEIEYY